MEKLRWNLQELRSHIRLLQGDREFLFDVIASIDWSDRIFRYHLGLFREALGQIPLNPEPDSVANLELLFNSTEEHEERMLVIRANLLACIYTVRNVFDHLAQLANALILAKPLSPGACDLIRVHRQLPPGPLSEEMGALLKSEWFKYVSAYSNASKHRALVKQSFHLSFVNGTVGVRAEGFEYGQGHPPRMLQEFPEGLLLVKNQVVTCGIALNEQVLRANA